MSNTLIARFAPLAIAAVALVGATGAATTASQAGMKNYSGSFSAQTLCTQMLTADEERYGCESRERTRRKLQRPTFPQPGAAPAAPMLRPGVGAEGGGGGGGRR